MQFYTQKMANDRQPDHLLSAGTFDNKMIVIEAATISKNKIQLKCII